MIVCVSSFCRREWDASSGPCACAREGEGSYDEEHRVLVSVVIVVIVAVVLRSERYTVLASRAVSRGA